jgi:nicotinamidase-related amidase
MRAAGSALVLVDYQQRLMPLIHDHEHVLHEALRLADAARLLDIPVLGTQQNPAGLGDNDARIRQRCASTLDKMHFDACEDGLLAALASHDEIVIAGCEAHVCLLQTTLGLLRAGKRVWVCAPACGSRAPADRELALARLARVGAGIVSVEMVLFEWLHDCRHPQFKDVLAVIKRGPP